MSLRLILNTAAVEAIVLGLPSNEDRPSKMEQCGRIGGRAGSHRPDTSLHLDPTHIPVQASVCGGFSSAGKGWSLRSRPPIGQSGAFAP